MKLKFLIFNFSFLILTACGVTKPVVTTSHERIEQHVMPVTVGADTIEIICSQQTITPSPLRGTPPINKGRVVKSTRGVNISRYETDTSTRIKLTLQPDTVFVPYTHHIRSDTIVVPDRICNEKLKQTKFMNVILLILLILFVATIIYRKIFHK